jgi:hypothetical protein
VIKFGRGGATAIREKVTKLGSYGLQDQRKWVQRCQRPSKVDPLTHGLQKRSVGGLSARGVPSGHLIFSVRSYNAHMVLRGLFDDQAR